MATLLLQLAAPATAPASASAQAAVSAPPPLISHTTGKKLILSGEGGSYFACETATGVSATPAHPRRCTLTGRSVWRGSERVGAASLLLSARTGGDGSRQQYAD